MLISNCYGMRFHRAKFKFEALSSHVPSRNHVSLLSRPATHRRVDRHDQLTMLFQLFWAESVAFAGRFFVMVGGSEVEKVVGESSKTADAE